MSRQPWMKFYPADWQSDHLLRSCSIAARGLWIELLCVMHKADPVGHLLVNGKAPTMSLLGILCGIPERETRRLLDELRTAGVFDEVDGVIVSRRMVRDAEKAERDRSNGKNGGGNPEIRRGTVPKADRVRPYRRTDSPAKTQRIFEKDGGRCHWCKTPLDTSDQLLPNAFHIGHIVAVCDGGTNDESNLVAACADCNHRRTRVGWSDTNLTDGPTLTPDTKAQIPDTRVQKDSLGASAPGGPATPDRFEEFWSVFPKREGSNPKKPARQRFQRLVANGIDPAAIIAAATAFARHHRTPTRFCPQAVTWLAQERFSDMEGDPSPPAAPRLEAPTDDAGWARVIGRCRMRWRWPDYLGPPPGKDGCRAPAHLLTEKDRSEYWRRTEAS